MALAIFTVSIASANSFLVNDDEQICSAAGDAAEANGADSGRSFEIANDTYESCMN